MTVLIDGADADRSSAMVQAIRAGQAEQTDILLRDSTVDGALDLGLASDVPTFAAERDLTELARESRHALLLTISDRVDVDEEALVSLIALLDDQNVASASCVLLGDVTAKTDRVARPAFGGIFPAGVSFISSPALSYSEPDVLQPLPQLVYPVVANTRHFTIWRASALAQLPPSQAGARAPAADVRLGLDLMAAGYRNVCSSRVMVQIHGPNMRQDGIDPVGPNYIPISDWQNILGRVTILRELF
jgi:hypothetical protein